MRTEDIVPLLLVFAPLSLSAIGGGSSTLAPLQHQAVDVYHWLSTAQFAHLFAISRAAPGPGSMLSTLVGWEVGGWAGAALATVCLYGPAAILCAGVAKVWHRYRDAPWHAILREGLAPVGTGLMLAGALAIVRVSGGGLLVWGVAAAAVLLLRLKPKLHPFIILSGGAFVFAAAWMLGGTSAPPVAA